MAVGGCNVELLVKEERSKISHCKFEVYCCFKLRDSNPITMATSDAAASVTLGAANSQFNGVKTTTGEGNTEEKRDKDNSSEETSEDEEDDDDDDDYDDETVLKNAGVKLQLSELQGLDKAPLTLLTEVS